MKHIAALSLILFDIPAITYAQTPSDVRDLVGARAAGGETQLQARGYRFLRTNTVGDQKWSFWWSDLQRQCVSVTTDNGRYSAINQVPGQNCQTNPSTNEAYQGDSPFRPALGSWERPLASCATARVKRRAYGRAADTHAIPIPENMSTATG
jgi:hypothetical protein